MNELYQVLDGLHLNVDFHNESGSSTTALESLDIVMLVDELMCHYDIEISVEDLIPENFNSAEAIYALVQRLKDEE